MIRRKENERIHLTMSVRVHRSLLLTQFFDLGLGLYVRKFLETSGGEFTEISGNLFKLLMSISCLQVQYIAK